jgi:hypothetical protein
MSIAYEGLLLVRQIGNDCIRGERLAAAVLS